MNRALFIVFGVVAACASAVPVRAASVPMVYNNTTNDVRAGWDMEGPGNPTVGGVTYYAEGSGVAGVVTAASEGISANEGSQVMKSYREPGTQSWATLTFSSLSTHTLTTTFAIQCKDSDSYELLLAGHTAGAENIMELYFLGTGAIQFYNSGWQTLTSTHVIGAWNTVVLKHTNSTANWTLSVNDSSPEAFTVTDAVNFPFGVAGSGGRLRSWKFQNANDAPSTVYIDAVPAVPEPSTIALLIPSVTGLLATAWRKRKRALKHVPDGVGRRPPHRSSQLSWRER
jgi:hypothetical protein